jgi:protein-tyrosine phosphatase
MSRILDLRQCDDRRDVVHRAVHLLAEGALVAVPTETVYVLAAQASQPDAVQRLAALVDDARTNGDSANPRCVLGVKGAAEARDYVPQMSPLGRKLSRRCWPGPVTLEFLAPAGEGLLTALPGGTSAALTSSGSVAIRVPAHEFVSDVLRLMPTPLVFSPDRIGHTTPFREAADVDARYGAACELLVDDGPCRYGEPSTLVRVENGKWSLRSAGVVSETAVGRLASEVFLFVCTGNTCRSPLAEGLFRKLLAERLQCSEEELFDRGYVVASAGLSAAPGSPASPESVVVGTQFGIDLRAHESQLLTERLLDQADRIYTMTRHHRDAILSARPDMSGRVELLSREKQDIPDPIGGAMSDYEWCAQEIERHLRTVLTQLTWN